MRFEAETPIAKRGLSLALVLASVAMALGLAVATPWLGFAPLLASLISTSYFFVARNQTPKKPGRGKHRVVADAEGLRIDGQLLMAHADIKRATAMLDEKALFVVHCEGRRFRPRCSVWVDSYEQSEELLRALAIDRAKSTAHFRALPPWAKHIRWLAALLTASPWAFVHLIRLIPGWGLGIIGAAYAIILLPLVLPQRVDVGQDGIFMKWLGNRRFIPFSNIGTATANKLGVELFLLTGRSFEIRLTQRDEGAKAEVQELMARISDGIAAHRTSVRADEESLLARSGRDLATWLREMRALGAGETGGYRTAAIPRERLWYIVENVAADPSARKGAALALSVLLDDDERGRLLALAERTASPRLRVALDGVGREREEPRLRIALETAESEAEEPMSERLPAAQMHRAK